MKLRGFIVSFALFVAAAAYFAHRASADVASPACANNVCMGQAVVGGQTVQYSYTQHLSSNGTFKIRMNGGLYNTSSLISYIVYDTPTFAFWDKYANPASGSVFLPEEDVNPGRSAYERKDSDGCSNCIVDQVMTMTFSGLASGQYAFSLSVIQNGASGGLADIPFYVDAAAPANGDESFVWSSVPHPTGTDAPCADGVDNDLDYFGDCADTQCTGSIGRVADGALCQQPEDSCADGFDNDADGLVDCSDPDCDGKLGQVSPAAYCQYQNEFGASTCGDGFDNDGDGRTDCLDNVSSPPGDATKACWKQQPYGCPVVEACATPQDDDKDKSYDDSYDDQPTTGVNCRDYDCAGDPACPAQENLDASGADADAQCFDALDNDLDRAIDCGDPDCLGAINPSNPSQICYEKEFDLGQRYQFCANSTDDDGDGPKDCGDLDCSRKFGNCGPCPSREDYTYDACADAKDNDNDVNLDCQDSDCTSGYAKLGTLGNAAYCSSNEDSGPLCGDGFDNDSDDAIDCADTACSGQSRCADPGCGQSYSCELNETACGDGYDNDGDGLSDCVDPNCYGHGDCAAKNWANSSCRVVPLQTALTGFTGSGPTIFARWYESTHVNATDVLHFTGDAGLGKTYDSITVIVGDNTDPAKYYPYASGAACTLSGTNADKFSFTSVDGHALQLFNQSGQAFQSFDIDLTCVTSATPAAVRSYPMSLSALKEPSDVPEYGDISASTTLYEGTVPIVSEVESEGETLVGGTLTMTIAYGESRRFRGVPSDPGAGLGTSGICSCTARIGGTDFATPGGECVTPLILVLSDFSSLTLQAKAEDGADNVGAFSSAQNVAVNVVPGITSALVMTAPAKPFFKDGSAQVGIDAEFTTATLSTFGAVCDVLLRTATGTLVGPGPIGTIPAQVTGNLVRCAGTVGMPTSGTADGEYFLSVRVQDDAGDVGESNRKPASICNALSAGTVCEKADFDNDGATEGLFTTLFTTDPKACDNCVNLANDQTDTNANGVGDVCEPNDVYGRCEVDRGIVCECDSDAPMSCSGPRCPGPSIADIPGSVPPAKQDPQKCREPWGLCTLGGEVCFEDNECPGGQGTCTGDGVTPCYRETDCTEAGGSCVGADRCESLLFPWVQIIGGNVFSKKKIVAADVPPQGLFNATFCISAKDTILNFVSELCTAATDATTRYERPKQSNSYSTVLGRIDIAGIESGTFGTVVNTTSDQFATVFNPSPLGGKVYVVDASGGDLTITNPITIANAVGSGRGNGTVLVKNGNLRIRANVTYDAAPLTSLRQLGSIGWIVLPDAGGNGGNVYVGKDVTDIAGAFFAGGTDGISSVEPPDADSASPLTVSGVMVARKFQLSRSYRSLQRGSEQILFDGRAIANPPPGLEDVAKSLPSFSDAPPQ